jgi:hypothetical protein
MKQPFSIGIVLILIYFGGVCFGSGGVSIGSYPLPLVEAEVLLTRWLQQGKSPVASNEHANGEIVLHGAHSGKMIRVLIRAHSPLSTEIELLETSGKEDVAAVKSSWEAFLVKSKQTGSVTIPERIRSLAAAVVCITSPADEQKMNFTGFLIDQGGTVLTIAHELNDLRNFKLLFSGGAVVEGHVVQSDIDKDLSVIESTHKGYKMIFPLKEGRTELHFEERIYMLCCNSKGSVQIQSGMVDKPKATVNGQTLLQVKLEQVFFGSSGSPVVDEHGRLVGVVKGRFRGMASRGFLIPIDTVRSFVGMGKS